MTNAKPSQLVTELVTELERLLRKTGCPACRYVEEAERSFFSWFEIESFSSVEMQARLRASMGICAAHARKLIEDIGEGHIMTTVMREAIAGAGECLGGDVSPGPCPACEALRAATERAIHVFVGGLLDPANARLYAEHSGMCLPHVVQAALTAEPPTLKLLAERLNESLAKADDDARVELLAGVDRDATRRERRRQALPGETAATSTIVGLCGRLAIEACPVCLSNGWIERRYVQWFVEHSLEHGPSIRSDPGELCSVHLTDVASADHVAAAGATQRQQAARRGELQRMLDHLSEPRPTGRRARFDDLESARAQFVGEHYCAACHARSEIDRSQLSLLMASLAVSPVRERYLNSHGLCVRHAIRARDGEAAQLVRSHADARLGVLGWELRETARKYAWACRHETSGPERDAWLRATVQVDGRVFEGGPVPMELAGGCRTGAEGDTGGTPRHREMM